MKKFMDADGKAVVEKMIGAIQKNRDYLSEVDGLIGDGDHGINMNKGFTLCMGRIGGMATGFSGALDALGDVLFNEIGGSMGPIYGTLFMEMAAQKREEITLPAFYDMLDNAVEALMTVVDARVGDKTLMDALIPARDALKASMDAGCDFDAALDKMCEAAERGKEATVDMTAKFGRSSRLGERSRGVPDAGATSCNILLQAMADGIRGLLA